MSASLCGRLADLVCFCFRSQTTWWESQTLGDNSDADNHQSLIMMISEDMRTLRLAQSSLPVSLHWCCASKLLVSWFESHMCAVLFSYHNYSNNNRTNVRATHHQTESNNTTTCPIMPIEMELGNRNHLKKLLQRNSPFDDSSATQESGEEILSFLLNDCKVLVIGAGGLGCELLKNLALMGIRDIELIDMDTIELSNLNRQFLFRTEDIGRPKAVVAAELIQRFVPDCKVIAHHKPIQDLDAGFYSKFNIVICGLDSIEARRWINNMMVGLLHYNEDGTVDQSSVIPLIDGGTEGLKGNARVILPGITACIECNLDLYPPAINYPLCTIANTPRLPEHTIEYAKVIQWSKEQPFGNGVHLDSDEPNHIKWIHGQAVARAKLFNIEPPSFRFTQGVVRRTIPAVSSTNACIAATCAIEAFKLITSTAKPMNNYQILNLSSGIYTHVFEAEKSADCPVCSTAHRRQ